MSYWTQNLLIQRPVMVKVTELDLKSVDEVITNFETTHRADQPLLVKPWAGFQPKVDRLAFRFYMECLKSALTEEPQYYSNTDLADARDARIEGTLTIRAPNEDAPLGTIAGLTRITNLYSQGELTDLLDFVFPDGFSKRRVISWISRTFTSISEQNSVFQRLRLLNILLLRADVQPLRLKQGGRWSDLPAEYQDAFLIIEALMTTEVDFLMQRYRMRGAFAMTRKYPIWQAKCALLAAMLFIRDLHIPYEHRRGIKECVAALQKWEGLSYDDIESNNGWELMHVIYKEEWDDGEGRDPIDVIRLLLKNIMGMRRRLIYVEIAWDRNILELHFDAMNFWKKEVLILANIDTPSLNPLIKRKRNGRFVLFGICDETLAKAEDGTLVPHTFWSKVKKIGTPLIVIQKDDKPCEKSLPLTPVPKAYMYAYTIEKAHSKW